MIRRTDRRRHLAADGLEPRALLASTAIGSVSFGPTSGGVTPRENLGPIQPDLSLVPLFRSMAYPPTMNGLPNPQPTDSEVAREYFTAEFTGTYTVNPGRFAGQAATIKIATKAVRSNQFLHGKAQVIITTTSNAAGGVDPAASFFGTAALYPQDTLYSGESVVLDLEGNPSSNPQPSIAALNSAGLPTHMVWVPDTASGTGYTGATGFNQGYGTMDAIYTPDRHPKNGASASGKVTMLYQGLINTAGILSFNDPATQ